MPSQYMPDLNVSNGTGFIVFARLLNDFTFGYFWITMLLCFFVIMVFSLNKFGIRQAVASSSFVSMMVGVLFRITGLVDDIQFFGLLLVFSLIFIYLVGSMRRE